MGEHDLRESRRGHVVIGFGQIKARDALTKWFEGVLQKNAKVGIIAEKHPTHEPGVFPKELQAGGADGEFAGCRAEDDAVVNLRTKTRAAFLMGFERIGSLSLHQITVAKQKPDAVAARELKHAAGVASAAFPKPRRERCAKGVELLRLQAPVVRRKWGTLSTREKGMGSNLFDLRLGVDRFDQAGITEPNADGDVGGGRFVVEIERGMRAGDDGLQGGVMPGVGHAVDEEHGFVEFLRAIVLGAENKAEHGVAVDGFVIFSAGGSRGEIRVTAFPEKLPVGA